MPLKKAIFYILLLGLFACKKESLNPVSAWFGTYSAISVIDDSPIRVFFNNGELTSKKATSFLARHGGIPTPESLSIETPNDSIVINEKSAQMNFSGRPEIYNYTFGEDLIILESQDSLHSSTYAFRDNQRFFYSSLCQYPLPESKNVTIPATHGFTTTSLFIDERYVEEVNDSTLRVPYVLFFNLVNDPQARDHWYPTLFNNRLNDKGYNVISTNDTLLVREFQVIYAKK